MSSRECATVICKTGRSLVRGTTACGSRESVTIRIKCPQGSTPHAILHNHPSNNPRPSSQDMETSKSHKVAICVKTDNALKCYRPK